MSNSTKPMFSILVPTFNQAGYLEKALDSIIAQSESDWEAVVVDDGSTDNTRQTMESYSLLDSRIRAYHKENGGTATALNKGLREARGEWICWLSSDDLFEPDKLSIHRQWIRRCPDARFFFTYFKLLFQATGQMNHRQDLWGPLPDRRYQTLGLFNRNFISGITICIHREIFKEIGKFDESLRYGQDYDRWLRITSRYPGIFIPEWTVVNRNHGGQGSEVFPQACYFDTAKSAIRFIGEFAYPDMLPLIDVRDYESAVDALTAGIKIAAEPEAFLYWLGVHPALLFCIYDWLSSFHEASEITIQEMLWNRLETLAYQEAFKHNGAFGNLWRHALMTARLRPKKVDRNGITPEVIGRSFFQQLLSKNSVQSVELARYFKEYMGGELLSTRNLNLTGLDIVLIAPFEGDVQQETAVTRYAAALIAAVGASVTLVVRGQSAVDFMDGVLIIHVPDPIILSTCTEGIRPWDICSPMHGAPAVPASVTLPICSNNGMEDGQIVVPDVENTTDIGITEFLSRFTAQIEKTTELNFQEIPAGSAETLPRRIYGKCRKILAHLKNSAAAQHIKNYIQVLYNRMHEKWTLFVRKLTAEVSAWAVDKNCPDNSAFGAFKKKGFFLLREHYYLPLPDEKDLTESFLESQSDLIGIEIDEVGMVHLAQDTLKQYNEEFRSFPTTQPEIASGELQYYLLNGGYMAVDGNIYYGLVRHLKPKKIIETGCGMSTLLCSEALKRNTKEDCSFEYICIEPYPQPYLSQNPYLLVDKFITAKIQHIDLRMVESLEANDILFIDTTHTLRIGGDVQFIYCEVLPRLQPGVYVHIHDISLPRQYPRIYHEHSHYYWNEQYVLQTYLTHNAKAEVVWAGNWLRLRDERRFDRLFPEFKIMRQVYPESEPTSFWYRTK